MESLSTARMGELLAPYLKPPANSALRVAGEAELLLKLQKYLDLLLKWNVRTNLTAVRGPEEIVRRHFGESLFAGMLLAEKLQPGDTLLDYGSGAGFPGLPIALLLPEIRVTLAESQNKKAAFLREAVRTLGVSAEVWAQRVELMPEAQRFTAVTLRAVDNMEAATAGARRRVAAGGWLVELSSVPSYENFRIPGTERGYVSFQPFA